VFVHTDESEVGFRPLATVFADSSVLATDVTNPAVFAVAYRFAVEVFPIAFAETVLCADPTGAEITFAATVTVSPETLAAAKFTVTSVVDATPTRDGVEAPTDTELGVRADAADAGATEVRTPRPKAATATSAMRLKVVFVDICFLSISRVREFPALGLNQISLFRFDESHVLIHQIPHRVSGRGEETYLFVCHLHRLREDGGLA
jgi:hypothetical protein